MDVTVWNGMIGLRPVEGDHGQSKSAHKMHIKMRAGAQARVISNADSDMCRFTIRYHPVPVS